MQTSKNIKTLSRLSDESLLHKFQQTGNTLYFEELYQRFSHLVYGVGLKYLQSAADSADMTNQLFEKWLQNPPAAPVQSVKNWVYRAAVNACHSRKRESQSEAKKQFEWSAFEKSGQTFMENEGFLRLIKRRENETDLEEKLEKAIIQLPEVQQRCIRLFFFEKKSYKKIASITGYPELKVKSYLQNGKRNLKIWLEKNQGK